MRSEEQWIEVDRCPVCNSPIYKKDDEVKFTGPPGCCHRLKKEENPMRKFSQRHYQEVADVITDWIRINPSMPTYYIESLINSFIITFKADSNRFDRWKFEEAIKACRIKFGRTG